jgi:hypothetical protein
MDLDFKVFRAEWSPNISKFEAIRVQASYSVYGRSSLILLFHCTNGADQTGPINTTRTPGAACAHLQLEVRHTRGAKYVREVRIGRSIDRVWRGSHRARSTYL